MKNDSSECPKCNEINKEWKYCDDWNLCPDCDKEVSEMIEKFDLERTLLPLNKKGSLLSPAQVPHKWIKVEDALPKDHQTVFTARRYLHEWGWGDIYYGVGRGTSYNLSDTFVWEGGGKVTHWMPIEEIKDEMD